MITSLLRKAVRACGYDIVRYRPPVLPLDLGADDRAIVERIAPFTMTSVERQMGVIQAVRHLVRHRISGAMVECGVWRGGSSMAVALTLAQEGDTGRDLYLFDTFEGMTPPTAADTTPDRTLAQTHLDRDADKQGWLWAVAGIDQVRHNLQSTGYPADRVRYVPGPVETTLPSRAPDGPIALLRLDTDWYESTRHELECLFPLLVEGGILIVDDYGHWEGARKAVDEYFAAYGRTFYLHRLDYTGRLLVKH